MFSSFTLSVSQLSIPQRLGLHGEDAYGVRYQAFFRLSTFGLVWEKGFRFAFLVPFLYFMFAFYSLSSLFSIAVLSSSPHFPYIVLLHVSISIFSSHLCAGSRDGTQSIGPGKKQAYG